MDLRAMLNDGSGPAAQASAPAKPPPHPRPASQQQHHHHHHQHQPPLSQQHNLPSTPTQSGPPHHFDYPQSVQPSPARTMSREYHPSQQPPFGSPPPPHAAGNPYAGPGRPQPPPLQQLSGPHDMRSPSASSIPQSPYAARPHSTPMRAEGAGYPFPGPASHPHPDLASPVQQNRYPPPGSHPARDPRESYSQPSGPMSSPNATGHPPPGYYAPAAMPQTPPVGMPGGAHPHLVTQQQHTRSGSAQSYHPYPQQFASPVGTNHQLPPSEHMRPPSQPPTPHGPPLSAGSRQSFGTGNFAQPPSPYHQRAPSSGVPYPYPPQQQHPQHPQPPQQPSPHTAPRPQPSPQASLQRASSVYDQSPVNSHAVDPQRASLSHSERERSISVSPKTRVPSIPSSAGHRSQASLSGPSGPAPDFDPRQMPSNPTMVREHLVRPEREDPPLTATRAERASTPAKRKMDDRDIKDADLEQQEPRPPPFPNGSLRPGSSSRPAAAHHADAPMPARRKPRHARPPVWALPFDRQQLKNGNFYLRKPHINHPHVNGTTKASHPPPRAEQPTSRHVSPEASRTTVAGPVANQPSPAPVRPLRPTMLGPWEPTLANITPVDDMVQSVADFLFLKVVQPSEVTRLHGQPGIHFEIEAKLGFLSSGQGAERFRFQPPLASEVVLDPRANYTPSFVSDMDESKHKFFNDHLNALVKQSSPQNPNNKNSAEPRIPINYVHKKEIDRFLELKDPRQALPPVLLRTIEDGHGRMPSIRVTRDKNNRIIAKIIKVKIGDLHIHMPRAMLDCRITVNVEVDYHGPLEGLDDGIGQPDRSDRHKDRLSYTQGVYQVDLTQVSQPEAGPGPQHKKHELEIELDTDAVVEHGRRAAQGAPNDYPFLVEGFVNNIRHLARKISGPAQQ